MNFTIHKFFSLLPSYRSTFTGCICDTLDMMHSKNEISFNELRYLEIFLEPVEDTVNGYMRGIYSFLTLKLVLRNEYPFVKSMDLPKDSE
ncbi:hypothetical protein AAH994_06050 [Weeksellaceae bacterium A-14]